MQLKQTKVLFLCLGNICRSPAGENILRSKLQKLKIKSIFIDSAGVLASKGNSIDERIYPTEGSSRKLNKNDLKEFDFILAMDQENKRDAISMGGGQNVKLLLEFMGNQRDVDDPYYGGDQGFDQCVRVIEEGCDAFIEFLQKEDII